MQKVRAVIFDMDGVIFNSEDLWKIMFVKANKKYGLSLSEEYRQSICGKTEYIIRNELKEMLPQTDVDGYRDFIALGVNSMIKNGDFEIKPGFVQLISYLKENGYKIALATSSSQERAMHMFRIKGFELSSLFDACVYGDDVGNKSKPDPYIFDMAARKLGIDNNECMVVEDSINGIKAAVNGGFVPIMAIDIIPPDSYCMEKCSHILENLSQLIEILENSI